MTDQVRLPAGAAHSLASDRQFANASWAAPVIMKRNLVAGQGAAIREMLIAARQGRVNDVPYIDQKAVGMIEATPEGTPLAGTGGGIR